MIDENKLLEEVQKRINYWDAKAAECDENGYLENMDICDGKAMELRVVVQLIVEMSQGDGREMQKTRVIDVFEKLTEKTALHDKSLAEMEKEINQIAGYSTSAAETIAKLLAEENRWRMRASIVAGAALLINSLALLIMVIGGLL